MHINRENFASAEKKATVNLKFQNVSRVTRIITITQSYFIKEKIDQIEKHSITLKK